jgi:head-tail adaptor
MIRFTQSGEMRHRISIAAPGETVAKGSITEGYGTGTNWWAKIDPVRGDEFVNADVPSSRLFYKLNMRWFDGLTAQHRITWTAQTATLNVHGEPKDLGGLHREHELMCVEAG